jgi:hypothetical protein
MMRTDPVKSEEEPEAMRLSMAGRHAPTED